MSGAYRISDLPGQRVSIACGSCGRRGDYAVARLLARHGDVMLPDLLTRLSADCPHRGGHDGRCYAVYEHPIDGRPQSG